MLGLLLLAFGLPATVLGWRVVWRVRAVAKRISGHYNGPQVPEWVRQAAPWRLIPGVGEVVLAWNRRAKLAKLLALPLLAIGPVVTLLGLFVLAHEVRGFHSADLTPLGIGALLAVAVLVLRSRRRARRPAVRRVATRQDQIW